MSEFHKYNDCKRSQTQRVHRISFALKFKDKQKGSVAIEIKIVIPLEGGRMGIDWKEVQESLKGHQNALYGNNLERGYLCVAVWSPSHVQLFAVSWTATRQASPSMVSPRQEHWSGLPRDQIHASCSGRRIFYG